MLINLFTNLWAEVSISEAHSDSVALKFGYNYNNLIKNLTLNKFSEYVIVIFKM